MPDTVLTLLLLGVPLLAGLAGSGLVLSAYSDLKSRPDEAETTALARGRLPVFFALSAVPVAFGLELWFLLAGMEQSNGALVGPAGTVTFWMAAGYAVVAVSVMASQTWQARVRLRDFISTQFGRVLPILVVANNSLVFALVLSFLVLGRLPDFLGPAPTLSDAAANTISLVFQVFAVASLGNLLGAWLSFRVRDITTVQGFMRAVTYVDIAAFLSIAALVWGFVQLGSL